MDLTTAIINRLDMAAYDLKRAKEQRDVRYLATAKLEIIKAKEYLDELIKKEGD